MTEISDRAKEVFSGLANPLRHRDFGFIFVFHSVITTAIIAVLASFVTTKQYVGNPINCLVSQNVDKIANDYCWTRSTFSKRLPAKSK